MRKKGAGFGPLPFSLSGGAFARPDVFYPKNLLWMACTAWSA